MHFSSTVDVNEQHRIDFRSISSSANLEIKIDGQTVVKDRGAQTKARTK
jgi:hypothetical protein